MITAAAQRRRCALISLSHSCMDMSSTGRSHPRARAHAPLRFTADDNNVTPLIGGGALHRTKTKMRSRLIDAECRLAIYVHWRDPSTIIRKGSAGEGRNRREKLREKPKLRRRRRRKIRRDE